MSVTANLATLPVPALADRKPFRVLIVGGGLGGLCLAQGLKAAGVAFTVFERDASAAAREQGYPLGLNSDGLSALHQNLPGDLWVCIDLARSARQHGIAFVDEQLARRDGAPIKQPPGVIGGAGSIRRAILRDLLLVGIEADVRFDCRLARCEILPDNRVRCGFDDGSSEDGHLLVGCDGTNSAVRQLFMPGTAQVETGGCAIVCQVPFDGDAAEAFLPPPLTETAVVADRLGQGMFLTRHRSGDSGADLDCIFLSFMSECRRLPDDVWRLSSEALHQVIVEKTEAWHPRLRHLVARAEAGKARVLRLRTSTKPVNRPAGPVTLLGDAVHPMPPTGGQGANTALRDAAVLCNAILQHTHAGQPLQACLDRYWCEMASYAFPIVERSTANLRRIIGQPGAAPARHEESHHDV